MVKRLIAIVLVLVVGIIAWRLMTSNQASPSPAPTIAPTASPISSVDPSPGCSNPRLNLTTDQEVSWPIEVVMVVDNRDPSCRWVVFEAQAGTIEVRDQNDQLISQGVLSTSEEWMTEQPVEYRAKLIQSAKPISNQIRLVITEDNPSGMGTPRQINLSLKIK